MSRKNLKLQGKNDTLSQCQSTAIGSYIGVLIVTVMSGLSVVFIDTIDKPKAAILIVTMLCWTGLTVIALLLLARTREHDDQN